MCRGGGGGGRGGEGGLSKSFTKNSNLKNIYFWEGVLVLVNFYKKFKSKKKNLGWGRGGGERGVCGGRGR